MSAPRGPGRRVEQLATERDVLLASIEDLDREHAAGDIGDDDYAAIRARYVARAADTLRALAPPEAPDGPGGAGSPPALPTARGDSHGPAGAGAGRRPFGRRARTYLGRRRVRGVLGLLGAVCAAGLVAVAAAHFAGVRLPGQSATGSVSLTSAAQVRQELDQASLLASAGELDKAVALYDTVLASVPHQPEALAYKGWFVRLAGVGRRSAVAVADGDALLRTAVAVAPGYAEARAFDAIALFDDRHDVRGAVAQLAAMLRDRPSATLLGAVGGEAVRIYAADHRRAPGALRRAAAATGTSPPARSSAS